MPRPRTCPATWNETTNVAWKTPIPGKGWSSPSLYQGRLYLTTAAPVDPDNEAGDALAAGLCLDAASGEQIVWMREVFRQAAATRRRFTVRTATPVRRRVVAGERIYVHFGHQGTACLDLAGKVIWRNNRIKYPPVHGNGGSPILVDGLLIFSCDGASDPSSSRSMRPPARKRGASSGRAIRAKKFSFCTPTVITVNGKTQLISPGSGVVNALDPATGREIWRVHHDGYSVIPKPVFGHGLRLSEHRLRLARSSWRFGPMAAAT